MNLLSAIRFFTRLPVGSSCGMASFQGAIVWLPVVGIVVGAVVALAMWLSFLILPFPICGLIGCFAWAAVTGCLHLDGVSDCADGLLVEVPRERRLEIMKDSRMGSFGGIALIFVLMTKTLALLLLCSNLEPGTQALPSLLGFCCLTAVLGRSAVFLSMKMPSARPGGLGAATGHGMAPRHGLAALALCLVFAVLNGKAGFLALLACLLGAMLLLSAVRKRLGGVTGDVYGCLIEMTECIALVALCAY